MRLFVGLGNPGSKYAHNRHNIGFMALDYYLKDKNLTPTQKFKGIIYKGPDVMYLKPQTFMNLSGESVGEAMRYFSIASEDVLVIYDDLDLPAGKIRVKGSGGSGGHKGIRSVIEYMDSNHITRIRIGIGRPIEMDVTEYVLQEFNKDQQKRIDQALKKVDEIILELLKNDIDSAMNKFN